MAQRTCTPKNPESNKEYIFLLDLVKRIGNSKKKFMPLCILRKQNINVVSMIERHPKTFCMIGKRVYLTKDVDSYVAKYGRRPEVTTGRKKQETVEETSGIKRACEQSLLYVQGNSGQIEYED